VQDVSWNPHEGAINCCFRFSFLPEYFFILNVQFHGFFLGDVWLIASVAADNVLQLWQMVCNIL
jgi:hypothetical protein